MQQVFVVDATRRPLMPCRPARARRLLSQHRAAVLRRFPFTIMLLSARPEAVVVPLRLKIDPGSRTTGLALVRETEQSGEVVWAAELSHRGERGPPRARETACGPTCPPSASHEISCSALCQPDSTQWMAATIARESGAERGDLGRAAGPLVSHRCYLPRSGALRHPTAAKPGYCWDRVSTRNPCRYRNPRVLAAQVGLSLCVLSSGGHGHQSLGDRPYRSPRVVAGVIARRTWPSPVTTATRPKATERHRSLGIPRSRHRPKPLRRMRQRSIAPGAPCTSGCWHLRCP